jgi:hypothetical protein
MIISQVVRRRRTRGVWSWASECIFWRRWLVSGPRRIRSYPSSRRLTRTSCRGQRDGKWYPNWWISITSFRLGCLWSRNRISLRLIGYASCAVILLVLVRESINGKARRKKRGTPLPPAATRLEEGEDHQSLFFNVFSIGRPIPSVKLHPVNNI